MRRAVRYGLLLAVLLFGMGAGDAGDGVGAGDMIGILREFGFPVFVALWFMWRVEKRMDRFTEAIQNLLTTVTIMAKTVDHWTPIGVPIPPGRAPTTPPGPGG